MMPFILFLGTLASWIALVVIRIKLFRRDTGHRIPLCPNFCPRTKDEQVLLEGMENR